MSRIPIPKPGTDTESRPITTAEDFACVLAATVGTFLSAGLEQAEVYLHYVKAYRKGISCEEMTLIHLAIIEDNHKNRYTILGHIDDDEEKFYDRITMEYQCASLLRLGFPQHGYVEWVAESMTNN